MLKRLFKKKDQVIEQEPNPNIIDDGSLVTLTGRSVERSVKPELGASILELAEKHKVDWNSNCRRGTCARCRCFVMEGMEYLTEANEAEINRLEQVELLEGYRLGCQAKIKAAGNIKVKHASYF